ncbi:MAG: hypothetical protein O3C57_05855 [Verrucomicrobia bacterium]|nr:hypothetical protein [Verrucomicrobiota bacterium]
MLLNRVSIAVALSFLVGGNLLHAQDEVVMPTQGEFIMQIVKDAAVIQEKILVADRFATLGLAPTDGWNVREPISLDIVKAAYARFLAGQPNSDPDAPPVDVDNMSILELRSAIVLAVIQAFTELDNDRQPFSPTGATWNF